MISRLSQSGLQKFFIILVAILSIALQYPQPKLDLDYYSELAANYTSTSNENNDPLKGITVVVTGPTSGLGLGVTKTLYEMGATIIAVGRSPKKLSSLSEEVGEGDGEKRLIPIVADFQDLDSVTTAADEIESKFEKIDFLVNNIGISYSPGDMATPQGFNLVFGGMFFLASSFILQGLIVIFLIPNEIIPTMLYAICLYFFSLNENTTVNYLSPFLFTERMLPILEKSTMKNNPRIIQIASTMHFTVDGSSLIPSSSDSLDSSSPAASQLNSSKMHGMKSYSESKLAQIYHMRALSRELQDNKSPVKVISLCPSWVATKIVGEMKDVVQLFAYDSNGYGFAPFLYAMFHPLAGIVGSDGDIINDYVTSCSYFCNCLPVKLLSGLLSKIDKSGNIRHLLLVSMGIPAMILQKPFASVGFREPSYESFNVDHQNQLFQWTREALAPWINMKKEEE